MADSTAGPARLKGRSYAETRCAVLDLIRSSGEISRSDLARRSALTEKTISGIVKSLLDADMIVEAGYAQSTGGKRRILLRLNDHESVRRRDLPRRCPLSPGHLRSRRHRDRP